MLLPKPQKRFLTEKIGPVMPILPSHAGIMTATEKTLIITSFIESFASSKISI